MQSDINKPPVHVGSVPGSLVKHEFAKASRVRVIEYSKESHEDVLLGDNTETCEFLGLPQFVARQRADAEAIIAAPLPTNTETSPAERSEVVQQPAVAKAVRWINIDGLADIDLLKAIGKKHRFHALALEDVVNVNQRAKTDSYENNIFMVLRMARDVRPFRTEQVSLFLLDNTLFTLQEYEGDCLDPVRQRIQGSKGRIRQRGADYLAYSVIDAIIDGYFPMLDKYDQVLKEIGDEIDDDPPHDIPKRLHSIRADLLNLRKVAQQHEDAVASILREESPLFSERTQPFLRDCLDHIRRLIDTADTYRETCGELRELYFALLGQKTNDVMKVLTVIATVFIPMTFIAGIYGMNFDSDASSLNMPELQWALGYPFAILVMLTTGGGILVYLRRKGWL